MTTISPTRQKEQRAWYMYDFGNSAYAAVILLAVYAAYFEGTVVGTVEGSRYWGIAVGIAMLVVAVISPFLGVIADFSGQKKRFLLMMTTMCVIFTGLLYFVQAGDVALGMGFFILAEIGYRGGQVFYNSLLPEIATQDEIATVSGKGWAIGSLGGILALLIVLPLIVLIGGESVVRLSFVITAVFFAVSSIPLFTTINEKTETYQLPEGKTYLSVAVERLKKTIGSVRDYKEFLKFMLAFLIYNDGIIAALDFAAIFGAVLYGLEQEQLIIFMIIVQVTNVLGAWYYGRQAEKRSFKRSLIEAILLMAAAVLALVFNTTLTGFFIIGAVAGFAIAGVQSVSRAMIGGFAPPGQSAEFYGFFAFTGRTSSFIGPTVYGFLATGFAQRFMAQGQPQALAEANGQRVGIVSVIVFLLVGLVILLTVDENKGREVARQGSVEAE